MKYIKGNILNHVQDYDVVIHGCNCFCTMGAGIAKVLVNKYPSILEADKKTKAGDKTKLGTYTSCVVEDGTHIINAYTQFKFGTQKRQLDYSALREALEEIKEDYGYTNNKFLMPKIGCGLAGGNWKIVQKHIQEALQDEDITIIEL